MRSRELVNHITKKCNETIKRKMDNLQYIGVKAPYGYLINKKEHKLEIDKNCAFIVYLIFNLYDKGFGFTSIADYLNKNDIVCPETYNKTKIYINNIERDSLKWNKSSVRKIILNKVYNGYYKYSDVKTHQEIIHDELWNRIELRLNNIKTRTGNDYFEINGNEFCGKVCCELCGQAFTMETSICREGVVKYLRCSCYDKRREHKYNCDNKLAIRYNELRDIVNMFIEKELFNNVNLDLNLIQEEYLKKLKDKDIINERIYLKMERTVIKKELDKYNLELINLKKSKNNLYKVKFEQINNNITNLNNRFLEIEKTLKEIYGFARSTLITNKDLYLDKFLIETFIDKIIIGKLEDKKRNIEIILN